MKKILFILLCSVAFIGASAQTGKVSVNAGFLFPSTLNATLGYEYPLSYGNAVEVYGEVGNHWQKPVCHNFWKGYFWDGGIVYKHRLARYKNGMMRLRLGPQFGAVQKKFFFGLEAGFEYSYVPQRTGVLCHTEEQCELPAWGYLPQRSAVGYKGSFLTI